MSAGCRHGHRTTCSPLRPGRLRPGYKEKGAWSSGRCCLLCAFCAFSWPTAFLGSFLAIEVIRFANAEVAEVFQRKAPLVRIRIVVEIGGRIVGYDVVEQVFLAGVDDLVWFTRWVQDAVACLKSPGEFARADFAGAGHDQIKFPFGRVTVEREISGAGRQTNQFDFKRGLRRWFRSGLRTLKGQ